MGAENLVKKDMEKVLNRFDLSEFLTQEVWSQDWVPGLTVRIPQCFRLGGILNLIPFQPCLPPSQLAPSPVQAGSGCF